MVLLTGQSREEHTAQLADALNVGNGNEIQEDDIDLTTVSEKTTIISNDEDDKDLFPTKETLQDVGADTENDIKEDDVEITTPEIQYYWTRVKKKQIRVMIRLVYWQS